MDEVSGIGRPYQVAQFERGELGIQWDNAAAKGPDCEQVQKEIDPVSVADEDAVAWLHALGFEHALAGASVDHGVRGGQGTTGYRFMNWTGGKLEGHRIGFGSAPGEHSWHGESVRFTGVMQWGMGTASVIPKISPLIADLDGKEPSMPVSG